MQDARDPILAELREQTRWLRLSGLQMLRLELDRLLRTDKQRAVYELSDGRRTVREVARIAGVGSGSVSRLWTTWIAAGVCSESPAAAGRAQHLVSLSQLGVDVPMTVLVEESNSGVDEVGGE
jgi:hypothetical protein